LTPCSLEGGKDVQLPLISEGNKNPGTSKEGPKECMSREQMRELVQIEAHSFGCSTLSVIWNQALNLAVA
jgi:hypothetical protein